MLCTILFLLIFTLKGLSQDIFFSAGNKIYSLNEDNTVTTIVTIAGLNTFIFDIAISPDNNFYGVTYNDNSIIKINISDGTFEHITELPLAFDILGNNVTSYASLVCSNNNEL